VRSNCGECCGGVVLSSHNEVYLLGSMGRLLCLDTIVSLPGPEVNSPQVPKHLCCTFKHTPAGHFWGNQVFGSDNRRPAARPSL
jgi:hypothetical protein